MNILVVDDSAAMRNMIIRTLRQAGFDGNEVTQAEDGAVALAAVKQSLPDLVLADWNMPNMTGIELLEAMNAEGLKTKFGFITTEATADMRAKATAGGAKFLISKPFSVESFQKVLSAIM
ncbi:MULTISPECIES: response regulator [Spongiibacter]|uniref:response regulator n=1 Tax=Spongiibacter TaxID=630749 RepID=UPI0003B77BB1|nr:MULTISPECIES: response regulator [Spongiibacter]MAY39526.1 response regulator [Spongiibacter sp.]MBI58592.1 response regulator [Spongiibacter sp.]MBO6754041.1 response regulator [Spongiibacter sp.]MBU71350.1 response regulator [Spongiibacter sp.]|tara:strand:- start:2587 stop:2946 length:360 start_codon:yes stop_codon:yes gene_type:complete